MKKLLLIFTGIMAFVLAEAQTSPSIPYQAVARDSFGTPLPSQSMKIRLSIRDSLSTGAVVYQETDSIVTDKLGMFTVNIGQGNVTSGSFSGINWSSGNKFIQTELDPTGGNSYVNLGTSQMMSVPFALYAQTSGNTNAPTKSRFGITLDGLGDVITTGSKGFTQVPYNGTITGWTIVSDQAGSIVVDVKRSVYSAFPTTSSIAGTCLPTLSSAQKNRSTTLSGWGNTAITAGDMFEFVVNSATTVTRATLVIETTTP